MPYTMSLIQSNHKVFCPKIVHFPMLQFAETSKYRRAVKESIKCCYLMFEALYS